MTLVKTSNNEQNYLKRVTLLRQGNYLLSLMTVIRDELTTSNAFAAAFDRISDLLIAAGSVSNKLSKAADHLSIPISALDLLPTERLTIRTPTGWTYEGRRQVKPVCGVSILRAGASFEAALRRAYGENLSMGKLLIQRNEETSLPVHLYSKLPAGIAEQSVLILEPMLATGGSAIKAIDVLKEKGVREEDIVFVNLVASKKGLETIMQRFPRLRLVTAAVDEALTVSNHIAPGLGDFGDRFYGT
ncbi:uracil phosphoribosyltransferase [Aspergillus foveolatus]|uniref:uracil phosphoribosyltransferase n=1 Tax=Aspergillus foveolatus TaxID=210207 RepID=UPI003CCE4D55